MTARSKAAQLGDSSGFAAAARSAGTRRQLLSGLAGDGEGADHGPPPPIPLDQLAHNPFNPREQLTDIQEMADSLLQDGQLQIAGVVTRAAFLKAYPGCEEELGNARFIVVDGNRRLAGARLAGLEALRCEINDDLVASAADALKNSLLFAIHNKHLSPMEEARGLGQLLEAYGGSQRALATRISKTHVWVSQRLALLRLTPALQAAVDAGELPVEDARRIGRLPQDEQAAAADAAAAARQARKADPETRAGRRARGAAPDAGEHSGNGVSTPPADGSPGPRAAATDGPGDTGSGATPAVSAAGGVPPSGNGVSTPPADGSPGPPAAATDGPGDTTPVGSTSPAPQVAGQASGVGIQAQAENGVSTPPADGSEVVDWSDVAALASAIRRHLTGEELAELLGLLTD